MFNINKKLKILSDKALSLCKEEFEKIDILTEYNQQKVLKAFIDNKVSESHFAPSSGYGYNDRGREILDRIFAQIFESEDALVRHNFVCGTHALTVALFGILRPGDNILCITGAPYDTLLGVIGKNKQNSGSLVEFGINYSEINLTKNGLVDFNAIEQNVNNEIKVVYMQKSRGYSLRSSLSTSDIKRIVKIVKNKNPNCVIILDNCYGEFVEYDEPTAYGVDLLVGSLIKNPGGGIAPTGGYIVGRQDLVEKCAYRLTAPGLGKEVGATLGTNKSLFMGIFNAPHVTGEALKTAVFSAALFELLGYEVFPKYNEIRSDIVQVIKLKNCENLIKFCQSIQKYSPIDSFVKPMPWDMPGYDNQIIMAAGTFNLGASIELSADAPLRDPYAVFLQGSLNFHSSKVAIMAAAEELISSN